MRVTTLVLMGMIVTHSLNGQPFAEQIKVFFRSVFITSPETASRRKLYDWNYFLLIQPKIAEQFNRKDAEYFIQALHEPQAPARVDHAITMAATLHYNAFLALILRQKDMIKAVGDDCPPLWRCESEQLERALLEACRVGNEAGALLLLQEKEIQGTAQTNTGATPLIFARLHRIHSVIEILEERQYELKELPCLHSGDPSWLQD